MTKRSRVRLGLIALPVAVAFLVVGLFGSSSTGADRPKCGGELATKVRGPGDNTIRGTEHRDVIVGGGGEDTIDGRRGGDLICGGGENTIGADGSDEIKGGEGGDTINGNAGNDFIEGEGGNDELNQDASGFFGELRGGPGRDHLYGDEGDDKLRGGGADDYLFGRAGPDELFGDAGNDFLGGQDGDDDLKGGADNDDLHGGPDADTCKQGPGSGSLLACEADLSVDVSGPDTASPGPITFTVLVQNNGPSDIGYKLVLDEDNMDLVCSGPQPWEGTHTERKLAVGATRSKEYTSTCTDPDPIGEEWVDAKVKIAEDNDDPVASNDTDRQTTTVS